MITLIQNMCTDTVPDEEFREIAAKLGRFFRASGPGSAFSSLSRNNADQTKRSQMALARYEVPPSLYRPASVYPVQPRKEPYSSSRMSRAFYLYRLAVREQIIRVDDLATAIVEASVRTKGARRASFSKRKISGSRGSVETLGSLGPS